MQSMFILMVVTSLIYYSNEIKLKTKPTTDNAYSIEQTHEFMDDEGFYSRTSLSKNSKGQFALLDAGNKTVNIYDKNGKLLEQFGSEGNGPGEWSNPFKVFTTENRIYVRDDMKVTIHDFNGKHIKDITLLSGGTAGTPLVAKGKLIITYEGNSRELMKQFSEDGELISTVENEGYVAPEAGRNETRVMIRIAFRLWPTESGYLKANNGEYKFEVLDNSFKSVKSYKRDFERIPRDFQAIMNNIKIDTDDPKEKARMMAGMEQRLMARLGKFQDDVSSVLGEYDNAYFVAVATDGENKLDIDVIKDDKLFTQLTLEERESIEEIRMENGSLIVNFKSDETGPFARVYSITKS
jgi:hypothetical protein